MLSIADMEKLRAAYSVYSDLSPAEALRALGDPSNEAIAASAANLILNSDRNLRVLALRALAHQRGELAMRSLLVGLNDETRRVCAVAIQASANFLGYEEVVARLEAIARDTRLKRKLRRRALSMLAGNEGHLLGDLSPPAAAALWRLMTAPEYRFAILFGMVRLALTPRVISILQAFTQSTDDAERQMAGRALGGERVIHIDGYSADAATQRRILSTCEIAHGRMYYWLPRAEISEEAPARQ